MINKFSERQLGGFRKILALGWSLLILLSFYDPVSLWLTHPDNLDSPFHIDPSVCILVQGECLQQVSYVLAPRIFWGIVVPSSIIILTVGGHDTWRRICPLSFFSQLPRSLGRGRKIKKVNPISGSVKYEPAAVTRESWLGRNYLYLQLLLFYLGLNIRLLFANGSGLGMGIFLLVTVSASIVVGYLFKGKSWCQYFCPMAPVQVFFTGTRGLVSTDAHLDSNKLTQSMCRTIDSKVGEKSGCVGCQVACIDIDVQLNYWEHAKKSDRELLFYGYFGLMVGFFVYQYLYAGSWDYYFSGAWSHDPNQLSSLLGPGFYIAGHTIDIPKIVAAPLTLIICASISYYAGQSTERVYRFYLDNQGKTTDITEIRHHCYTFWVFLSFNTFFTFILRPSLQILPDSIRFMPTLILLGLSFSWLLQSLKRSEDRYARENVKIGLIKQLKKLKIDWQKSLRGRSIEDLDPDEVDVLIKSLPPRHNQKIKR
jgi:hypothetical protein